MEVCEFSDCWEWTGHKDRWGYPKVTLRNDNGRPTGYFAHRLMLELVHGVYFPFDEAGHTCNNPSCINPKHLEIQTKTFNLSERLGYRPVKGKGNMIPVLYPIPDWKPHPFLVKLLAVPETDDCPF